MLVYQSEPVGVELFFHVNTFFGFMYVTYCAHRNLGQRNKKYTFQK